MNIDELIQRSHQMAIEKGWWPDGEERSVVEQVNNFHAEISEAWEEYRAGRMETWWSGHDSRGRVIQRIGEDAAYEAAVLLQAGYKPEGFWVEIADLLIRIADTMGAYGWPMTRRVLSRPDERLPLFGEISEIPMFIKDLRRSLHFMEEPIVDAWSVSSAAVACEMIDQCISFALRFGVDLLALCELKMAYNATRPMRHGGKLA